MKRILPVCVCCALALSAASCSYLSLVRIVTPTVTVEQAVQKKEDILASNNPAYQQMVTDSLRRTIVVLKDVVVSDVIVSPNIDYSYCVVVTVPTSKGDVDCYIYSSEIRTISKIEKGKTKINAIGRFGRFFSLLDSQFTKIDMLESDITIL